MELAFYQIKPAEGVGVVAAAKRLKTQYVELAMPGPMDGFVWVVIKETATVRLYVAPEVGTVVARKSNLNFGR